MKKAADIRKEASSQLLADKIKLLREQLKFRLQKASGNLSKTHQLKVNRRHVARINSILAEKQRAGEV